MVDSSRPSRPFGSFKTRYDVPANRAPRPEDMLRPTNARETETGDIPDPKEPYFDMLCSTGWNLTIKYVLMPYLSRLRGALLKQTDLTTEERARLVGSLTTCEYLVTELYKRAGEQVPVGVADSFR